ncbi:hypothetical protein ABW19_dt0205014 [Dactylella cylindrospora]|nr:hypothetical protein ABW19_dt0205014 [Dactylella cylindrospora]
MRGIFQSAIAATAIATVFATPLNHGRHQHHHHEKRALVILTKTQQVVEIEYVYSTIYVDPATIVSSESSTSTLTSSSLSASTFSSYIPPPPPPPPSTSESTSSVAIASQPILFYDPNTIVPTTSTTSTTSSSISVYTPPPSPVPVYTPSPSPEPAPISTSVPDSGTSGKDLFYGEGTYYDCGIGSCGNTNSNEDYIAALSKLRMLKVEGPNPNLNPLCGQKIRVYSDMAPDGVVFTVQDKCPGCPNENDVDMCRGPFLRLLGTEEQGRIKIWWHFEN